MEKINALSILFYCLFSFFAFYQQHHASNFRESSQVFLLVLNIFAILGFIVGLAYLVYYGYKVAWWTPVIIFIIGISSKFFLFKIERFVSGFILSMLGFIALPIFGYLMFKYIPIT